MPTAYIAMVSAYLFAVTIGAWRYRKPKADTSNSLRFALLIPAHDEEHGVARVVEDALNLDYPPEDVGVFVIADNCTDRTADRARKAGATVFERSDPVNRGKGQALDWCLQTQRATLEAYDIISVVDADMIIDPRYLRELARTFGVAAVQAVQARYTIAHPERNWRTALGFMSFAVVNHVRPAGRCWLGGTAELKGSGMAFRQQLLMRYGWAAHTVTEDIEFARRLLLDGIRVDYDPQAIVLSEIPTQAGQAEVQQRRWEGGKWHLFRVYFPRFLKALLRKPSRAYADALLDTLVPPISLLVALIAICGGAWLYLDPRGTIPLVGCLGAVTFCIATGLVQLRAPLKVWLYVAAVPAYLAWKLPLLVRVLLSRAPMIWERTPRDEELDNKS